jgi:hypothetical protein
MRDIVQVSISILNPYSGTISNGSVIQPINPIEEDTNFIQDGLLMALGELLDSSTLWSL